MRQRSLNERIGIFRAPTTRTATPQPPKLPACLPSPSLMVVGAMGCGGDGGSLLEFKEGRGRSIALETVRERGRHQRA